jgi:hypothetical protein
MNRHKRLRRAAAVVACVVLAIVISNWLYTQPVVNPSPARVEGDAAIGGRSADYGQPLAALNHEDELSPPDAEAETAERAPSGNTELVVGKAPNELIVGTVSDELGSAVAGVAIFGIELPRSRGKFVSAAQARTDANGYFELKRPERYSDRPIFAWHPDYAVGWAMPVHGAVRIVLHPGGTITGAYTLVRSYVPTPPSKFMPVTSCRTSVSVRALR